MKTHIQTLSSREVYRNPWMTVQEDILRREDGSEGLYGVVRKADFSLVIPYEAGAFYLVDPYRYPVRVRMLEFPQGAWEDRADERGGHIEDSSTLAAHALLQVHGLGPFGPPSARSEE